MLAKTHAAAVHGVDARTIEIRVVASDDILRIFAL